MKREIKQYDFVKLRKSARKAFYNRPERIEDFAVGGNVENLRSDQFLDFVEMYLGFESGENLGRVMEIIDEESVKVLYVRPISHATDYMFYDPKDLVKV